jgi:sialic acid synthase SpsE/sugar phosphate isomerase/epimerase
MIIERDISPFVVLASAPLSVALDKIQANKARFIVCVSEHGSLEGVLTDGDFRRWMIQKKEFDPETPVGMVCNNNVTTALVDSSTKDIAALLSDKVTFVPLLDRSGKVRAVARKGAAELWIGQRVITEESPSFIIAEIGINHNGSPDLAKRLIDLAADAGADAAKFQMRHMSSMYRNDGNANNASEDLGAQYTLEVLARATLTDDEMIDAFDHCRARGLIPLCSPWDLESVAVLAAYGLEGYKVASADMTNHDLLRAIAAIGKPMMVSTGMSSEQEILEAASLLRGWGAPFSLLHCNSTYPAPFKDVNLRYIDRLRDIGGGLVGYSGHERGYAVVLAAIARGAKIIEKHFTLDRTMLGNDHRVSLEPGEFAAMVEAIRQVEESLGDGRARVVTPGERMNRDVLAKSLVAAVDIPTGVTIESSMIDVKSPGRGLQPNRRDILVGRKAKRDMKAGDFFFASDLREDTIKPRAYSFKRPWGIPVRHHDWRSLYQGLPMDFLEFHLSYKDIEIDPATCFDETLDLGLVVHSPDLFADDHILNLAAEDEEYRRLSIANLQRAIDAARKIRPYFKAAERIPLIASLGGVSRNGPLPVSSRAPLYERVADSLSRLDSEGVEILAQTLPPFPWYLGGQLFCNLFVDPEDTAQFCRDTGFRICFDISHSKLTANHRRRKFHEFVEILGPHVGHLHLVDAADIDDEGLQIGEGEVNFVDVAERLDRLCPKAAFIPEIWQGHKNDGEGFWIALERLEGLF